MILRTLLLSALFGIVTAASAVVVEKTVEYSAGGVICEGFHAYDDSVQGPRPAVLIVHQWTGLSDYEKMRARMLVGLGYNVFALDIYGKGIRPPGPPASAEEAGKYKKDRALFRERLNAGLRVLLADERTDPKRVAAIGYCFGGTTVLELARSGAEVAGVVSFHGGLDTPTPGDAKHIRTKVLVLHGADDPYVPLEQVAGFEQEMRQGGVDWQLIAYGGAVHGFTNPANGSDNSKGAAYNAAADARSWLAMQQFFNEVLGPVQKAP